jgi:subtilisin family serine protease
VNVVSAYNHYVFGEDDEVDESMTWNGFPYSAESGTSMACPVVSGIVALWLQAKPDLTLDNLMEVLSKTSRNDEYTEILPERWGYGKIDAKKGLEYILNSTGIEQISQTTTTATNYSYDKGWYTLDGRRLTTRPASRGLYIHN